MGLLGFKSDLQQGHGSYVLEYRCDLCEAACQHCYSCRWDVGLERGWFERYLEPRVGFIDQDLPIPFGPLLGICSDEHGNVNLPHLPFLVEGDITLSGDDGLVDQQRGAWIRFHGREKAANDLEGILIAPIVQALPQDPAVAVFAQGL